ncbi:MAG: dTDP-4-dehydrorhamnose 3,5-epimerase [Xanthomonadales bacterium]|nr:dTDP-4-dehydrorhamnose 3,5-epimerase [Xanthomonadales bacterium]
MQVLPTPLEGVLIFEPRVFGDERGFFMENWRASAYESAGLPRTLTQSNYSRSEHGVIRGLHFQQPEPQGKLVSVIHGEIWDVAVDLRHGSPTFGRWTAAALSAQNHRQLYVPEGFAHGFCVTGESALVHYLCTREFRAEYDRAVAWDDPDIGISWPLSPVSMSQRDAAAPRLADLAPDELPVYES